MMTPKSSGLGRGLSALIGEESMPTRGQAKATHTLPTAFLKPNRFQPRKTFVEKDLHDLTESVREKGILQPILVRPLSGDTYEIVAGERRWRAAQQAQLHDVPVVVREMSDSEALELAIVENVQRADLNVIEEAAAYHELTDRFGYTQERIAKEVGKTQGHISNTIRLLRLPESVKVMLRDGQLTAGHARTLLSADDPEARAREIVASAMNVREAEQRSKSKKRARGVKVEEDVNIKDAESNISNLLGLIVKIVHKGDKGGEVRIRYRTLEQFDDLIRRLSVAG
jgi:ParB family transcriptional regulator, chromosome partitioning protein